MDEDDDDLFLSREDEPPVEYDEYDDDGSLSCLLFVLDEILFTFLLLLLLLELCLLSFSLSFEEDDEDVLDVEMTFDGTFVELLE